MGTGSLHAWPVSDSVRCYCPAGADASRGQAASRHPETISQRCGGLWHHSQVCASVVVHCVLQGASLVLPVRWDDIHVRTWLQGRGLCRFMEGRGPQHCTQCHHQCRQACALIIAKHGHWCCLHAAGLAAPSAQGCGALRVLACTHSWFAMYLQLSWRATTRSAAVVSSVPRANSACSRCAPPSTVVLYTTPVANLQLDA